jgi:long-chain fatty acid transport protein
MGKFRNFVLSTTALVGLAATTATSALAEGFEIREQSAWGQGASYAGVAAGGSVSSMFWNPATMTQTGRFALEASGSLLFPQASQTGVTNLAPLGFTDGTPNSGQDAFVLASYTTIRLTDRIWAGVSINSPFGLETAFQNPNWAGAFYGQSSTLRTYSATPSLAIKLTDWLSVGGGFQAQYGLTDLKFATGFAPATPPFPPTGPQILLAQAMGHGWGFGWTAGVTVTPTSSTQIGLGYRSGIDQKIGGNLDTGAFVGLGTQGTVYTTIKLPGIASLGLRQGLTTQLTLLGTVEWTNWSRIGTATLTQGNGSPALAPSGNVVQVPFQWRDSWFYSLGLEYAVVPAWTLRGGVAYESNAIPDQVRTPLVPDDSRMWYSVGATNTVGNFKIDLAYSFIDVKTAPINIGPGNPSFNGLATYNGSSRGNVSIFSIGVKYMMAPPPPAVSTRG